MQSGKHLRQREGRTALFMLLSGIACIAIVFLVMLFAALPHPSQKPPAVDTGQSAAATSDATSTESEPGSSAAEDAPRIDSDLLKSIIGEDDAAKLIAMARLDGDANWIAHNPDAYSSIGDVRQRKILRLAAEEPNALAFVRNYPEQSPAETANMDPSLALNVPALSGTMFDTRVPHLFQWDRRWGYTMYTSSAFGLSGCGPTSMAMIYQGLTGLDDISPFDMGQRSRADGHVDDDLGTDIGLFYDESDQLGIACTPIDVTGDAIRTSLADGYLLVANLQPGYFTEEGHFFVLAGLAEDGSVIVNDPYSVVRSSQTWDADFIANESSAILAFSLYQGE